MRRQWWVVLLAFVALAGMAVPESAAARELKDKGPFALVPRVGGARPPSFVGVDTAGRLVGVALTGTGELVAYVCDGAATGVWFEGGFKESATTATLTGKQGARLTLDLTSDPFTGSVTIGGAKETFTLTPAVGSAGLYRERHGKQLSGWVVDNNGAIFGVTEAGAKVVSSVQVGTPSSSPPIESNPPGNGAVTTGFVRCAVAQFRLEREAAKLANGGSSAGSYVQAQNARDAACNPGNASSS